MTHPDNDDVIVHRKRGTPTAVYVLGTASAPGQFLLRTRDEAVAQALAFGKRQHVQAWFANDEDDFELLGTFQAMARRNYVSVDRTFEITLSGTPAGTWWTVEHVFDKSLCCEIRVPGMDSIMASTEDVAFARACDCIDMWLRSKTLTTTLRS